MIEPQFYSKNSSMQITDNIYVLETYFDLTKWTTCQNQSVLDVGCGEGFTTAELLLPKLPKCVKKLVGCDISEKMVKFAKQTYENSKLDFCQLDLTDGKTCKEFGPQFNHIFSFYCLHWLPDQRKAFKNIYTLLKPGGDMLLSFLGTTPIYEIYERLSKNIHWAPYCRKEIISPYHKCENPEKYITILLKQTGFLDIKCTVEKRCYVFENWENLKSSTMAVNPTLHLLSPVDREQYIEDFFAEVKKLYSYRTCDNNNQLPIPVHYKLITVYGRKPANDLNF